MKSESPLVTFVLGTRPEAIKLAPVINTFKSCNLLDIRVILTGQHIEMVSQVMNIFDLKADININLMNPNQTLTHITNKTLKGLKTEFSNFMPDLVLVQGDTSTAFAAALASFYEKIPVGHIEAGLRTNNIFDPYPEEANRRLISQIASIHFAPTEGSKNNLINSDITGQIYVTGNTVIDSLLSISPKAPKLVLNGDSLENKRLILVTVHRRENRGAILDEIIKGILLILSAHEDIVVLLPMHPNPEVREPIKKALGDHSRVFLNEPLNYIKLVSALNKCYFLLTDSGGLQEEAPALGKPVLILRKTTERPEAIESGTAKLIGTNSMNIFKEADKLLSNSTFYQSMAKANNPFGDGKASKRILSSCKKILNIN